MPPRAQSVRPQNLSPAEGEIIHFFVHLASDLSMPKSIGEIFGILFCAEEPMAFEEVVAKLGLSKGSASQGLRVLQKINAVTTVYVARDRRTFYQAETSMRKLFSGVLNETVRPHLESNEEHLERIHDLLQDGGDSALLQERVASLQSWNRKAKRILPWLVKLTATKPAAKPATD